MSLRDRSPWVSFRGAPIPAKIPVRTQIYSSRGDPVLSNEQTDQLTRAYQEFAMRVSLTANPQGFYREEFTLADGTRVVFTSNGMMRHAIVWMSDEAIDAAGFGGAGRPGEDGLDDDDDGDDDGDDDDGDDPDDALPGDFVVTRTVDGSSRRSFVRVGENGEIELEDTELEYGHRGFWQNPSNPNIRLSWSRNAVFSEGDELWMAWPIDIFQIVIVGVFAETMNTVFVAVTGDRDPVNTAPNMIGNRIIRFDKVEGSAQYVGTLIYSDDPATSNYYARLVPNLPYDASGFSGLHFFRDGKDLVRQSANLKTGEVSIARFPDAGGGAVNYSTTVRTYTLPWVPWIDMRQITHPDGSTSIDQSTHYPGHGHVLTNTSSIDFEIYSGPYGSVRYSDYFDSTKNSHTSMGHVVPPGAFTFAVGTTRVEASVSWTRTIRIGPIEYVQTCSGHYIANYTGPHQPNGPNGGWESHVTDFVWTEDSEEFGGASVQIYPNTSPLYYTILWTKQYVRLRSDPIFTRESAPGPFDKGSVDQIRSTSTNPLYALQIVEYVLHVVGGVFVRWDILRIRRIELGTPQTRNDHRMGHTYNYLESYLQGLRASWMPEWGASWINIRRIPRDASKDLPATQDNTSSGAGTVPPQASGVSTTPELLSQRAVQLNGKVFSVSYSPASSVWFYSRNISSFLTGATPEELEEKIEIPIRISLSSDRINFRQLPLFGAI